MPTVPPPLLRARGITLQASRRLSTHRGGRWHAQQILNGVTESRKAVQIHTGISLTDPVRRIGVCHCCTACTSQRPHSGLLSMQAMISRSNAVGLATSYLLFFAASIAAAASAPLRLAVLQVARGQDSSGLGEATQALHDAKQKGAQLAVVRWAPSTLARIHSAVTLAIRPRCLRSTSHSLGLDRALFVC